MAPLRSSRASRSATAGGDISMARARARCDWRASTESTRSSARSSSSRSAFGVGGAETSVSLARGAELLVICQGPVINPGDVRYSEGYRTYQCKSLHLGFLHL